MNIVSNNRIIPIIRKVNLVTSVSISIEDNTFKVKNKSNTSFNKKKVNIIRKFWVFSIIKRISPAKMMNNIKINKNNKLR